MLNSIKILPPREDLFLLILNLSLIEHHVCGRRIRQQKGAEFTARIHVLVLLVHHLMEILQVIEDPRISYQTLKQHQYQLYHLALFNIIMWRSLVQFMWPKAAWI